MPESRSIAPVQGKGRRREQHDRQFRKGGGVGGEYLLNDVLGGGAFKGREPRDVKWYLMGGADSFLATWKSRGPSETKSFRPNLMPVQDRTGLKHKESWASSPPVLCFSLGRGERMPIWEKRKSPVNSGTRLGKDFSLGRSKVEMNLEHWDGGSGAYRC